MTSTAPTPSSEVAIFGCLLRNGKGAMSPALARYVLTLGFTEEEQAHMVELAARNQEGALSPEEKEELQHHIRAGHLLALLHSEARRTLKNKVS